MPRLETSSPTSRNMLGKVSAYYQDGMDRYQRLKPRHKMTVWAVALLNVLIVAIILIITPSRIGRWFNSFGLKIRDMGPGGIVLLCLFVVVASHPPLFGSTASLTLIGFTYGMWPGALIASGSAIVGAGLAFLSVRRFFPKLFKANAKWEAFGHVMRDKGLPLVIMIRYCPLPWAISNGFFASVESVKFWHFMIATVIYQPRLLVPVFIGSRLESLFDSSPNDGDDGTGGGDDGSHHSDRFKFWLNLGSIILGLTISAATGIWIYRLTLEQMRKMEEGKLAAAALEEGTGIYRDELGESDFELGEGDEDDFDDEPLNQRNSRNGASLSTGGRPHGALRRTSSSGGEE